MTALSGVTPFAWYSSFNSDAGLKVPSSRTACAQGILAAPGMWPPRCAPSCGRFSGASSSPKEYARSEEHTSELQSLAYLVCRLLLEKKKRHSVFQVPQHYGSTGPILPASPYSQSPPAELRPT